MLAESRFRWEMEYLARRCRVLPLDEIVERITAGRALPPRAVAITFDDGFRNNGTVAYPILEQLGLPATVFLITGLVGSRDTPWADRLFHAVARSRRLRLDLSAHGAGRWALHTRASRTRTGVALVEHLKMVDPARRRRLLDDVAEQLSADLAAVLARTDGPCAMLTPPEIARLSGDGLMSFGAHTHTHEILTRMPLAAAADEIRRSKAAVEELTGRPVHAFAYPNGTATDWNDAIRDEVSLVGFRCAFVSGGGRIGRVFDPYALTRIGIGPIQSRWRFRLKLTGAVDVAAIVKGQTVEPPGARRPEVEGGSVGA
jgi:peptidoglycan/xylan/chitin deacetylase (PgdA/CDA1 family)